MATEAQINANRRNAKLSTGPRSDDGKASVRQNALRHGFCSGLALMDDEREKDFADLHRILLEENQPVGANEELLVYTMSVHMHNFGRANLALCDALEAAEMDQQSVPSFPLCLRYQGAADRGFRQNLNQLRKLQKERKLEEIGFDSQTPVEVPAETPEAPPTPPAEAPEKKPVAATRPSPPPIPAELAAQRPVETGEHIEKVPVSPSQTSPKAA